MIQDTAWSPRFVPSTTATAATSGEAIAGTDTTKFITPSLLPAATSYHAGPVVNGRAPRQGLVFDGTTGSSGTLGSIPSGTWTASAVIDVPTSNPASNIMALTMGLGYGVAGGGSFVLGDINTSGNLTISQWAGTFPAYREATISGFRAAYSGKRVHLAAVVTGAALTVYINGVATSYTEASGAGAPAWGATLGSANVFVGKGQSALYYFSGGIYAPLIYNRALSASEVVSLYESGAPAGADYNSASNTAINTSNWDNSNWPYTSYTGVSSTGFTAVMSTVNIGIAEIVPTPVNGTTGQRIRVTFSATLTSGVTPTLRLLNAAYTTVSNAVALTAGSNTVELVATAPFTKIGFYTSGVTSYAVSGISVVRAGLLLAPDAAQAGGGLVWYDTSGNAANITLPASGVSWNVPSSQVLGGNWTTSGNLTISKSSTTTGPVLQLENTNDAIDAGGTLGRLQFYSGDDSGGGNSVRAWIDSIQTTTTPVGSALRFAVANGANAAGEVVRIAETGNFLLGTTTDVGPRVLSKAKDNTYAGAGIGIVDQSAGTSYITRANGTFYISNNGSTDHFALDASGNATFAGKVTPTSGIVGVTTNSNAAAGIVGEFVSSAVVGASAVSLTNATAANITSISLTAGDWDVTGLVQYNFTGATCSYVFHGFSTASAAFGAPNSYVQDYRNYTTASVSTHNPSLTFRISLAATTTIYFVTQADFSAGTVAAYGRIQARRVR